MTDIPPTPFSTLTRARDIAVKNGIRYAYTGNVHDKAGESTYCHKCGEILIGRDWYTLSDWNIDESGNCMKCGTPVAGRFNSAPGTWGSKRLTIQID